LLYGVIMAEPRRLLLNKGCLNCGSSFTNKSGLSYKRFEKQKYCSRQCRSKYLTKSANDRFDEKYIPEPNSGCWIWLGCYNSGGYGQIKTDTGMTYAHRFSYERFIGTIPAKYEIDHRCKNVACVNPNHLEAVTKLENNRRSNSKSAKQARQTHCINGHELFGSNLYLRKDGRRACRKCMYIRNKKRWLRSRQLQSR